MTGRRIIIDFEVPGCDSEPRTEADDVVEHFRMHCENIQALLRSQGNDFTYSFKVEK